MTQAGEVLQYHARRIFSEVHQIHMKMDEINLMQRGKITIGCSGNHLLLPSLATFQKSILVLNYPSSTLPQMKL